MNFDSVSLLNKVKVQCGAWEGHVHWASRPVWPALLVTYCRHSELAGYLQLCLTSLLVLQHRGFGILAFNFLIDK